MILFILLLAISGFAISLYSYRIEQQLKKLPNYKPACDLSAKVSCSKPIKSQYAHLIYFSNSVLAMCYYAAIALFALFYAKFLLLLTSIFGAVFSALLAYLLFFKIKSVCLLCIALYGLNALILIFSILEFVKGSL